MGLSHWLLFFNLDKKKKKELSFMFPKFFIMTDLQYELL